MGEALGEGDPPGSSPPGTGASAATAGLGEGGTTGAATVRALSTWYSCCCTWSSFCFSSSNCAWLMPRGVRQITSTATRTSNPSTA